MRGKIEPRQEHPLPCMPNITAFNPWPRYVCRIHSCWMAAQGTHLCFRALRALITLVLCLGYALLSAVLFLAVDVNRDPLCQPHVIVGSRSSLKVSMTWIGTLFCSSKAMDPFPRWECTRAKQSPFPCDIKRVPLRDFFRLVYGRAPFSPHAPQSASIRSVSCMLHSSLHIGHRGNSASCALGMSTQNCCRRTGVRWRG